MLFYLLRDGCMLRVTIKKRLYVGCNPEALINKNQEYI